ncbi:HD domain-containing protein [[Clostridium] innocuum]|nr:HD domain-containing protein [[Clostridium] innocuum]
MSSKIKELYDGYKGELKAMIISVNRGVTAKGAPYLSFVFQDKSGSIDAKYWNVSEELLHRFEPGMLVVMSGDVLCHQKQLQFRVQQMKKLDETANVADYVKEGPVSQQELRENIQLYIDDITNTVMKQLVCGILQDHEKDFFEYPAATRNHHDFFSGLATHVLGMLQLAEQLCHLYPLLDKDLLYSGVILHDVGKTVELSGAIVSEYTTQGKLLGHISIMQAEVLAKAKELGVEDSEETMLLRHMILSHHGVYEYGSPVLPMVPEAEMLHMIDNIDARMNTLSKALEPVQDGGFTQRVFALENRSFYKSRYKNSDGK